MDKSLVGHWPSVLVVGSSSAVCGRGKVGADGAGGAVSEVIGAVGGAVRFGAREAQHHGQEHQTVEQAEGHRQQEYLKINE